MRTRILTLALAALAFCGFNSRAGLEHLTPKPAAMTVGTGELTLAPGFSIGYDAALPAEMVKEIDNFAKAITATTNLAPTHAAGSGLINVSADATLPAEGYSLTVSAEGAEIKAATPAGLFYAFQTLKKLMPVNVAAGVAGAPDAVYSVPVLTINDSPRFEYRGFMLDVSRHFFDADFVKKMIDVMAIYKLNRFHWHLTDDQGWRLPVAKYPKLTKEGATNKNILLSNYTDQTQTRAGKDVVYGPYAYTEDEIRDVVAYAKERHIEVIPEVDMPGHMVAAIHAYPELSTDPNSEKTSIHEDFSHEIWNKGGVSRDVLDVSNPKVLTFVQDVIDVLADLFPYNYIHIGGDECPTLAWENSDACKALKQELGCSDFHGLQTNFTKQVADYAKSKGRKIMGWNEIITSGSVDMNIIKEIDPTIFCWIGGEAQSQANGLKHVYTPFNGGYYINRSYANHDKFGAVGDGALSVTLTVNPPLNSNCIGVQGTFWTEQVDRPTDVEYLALPRLIGIAEQGWAPAGKDYDEVMGRIIADSELLDMAGYNYGKHQMVLPTYAKPDPEKLYRLQTKATDERQGNVAEVLAPGHDFISSKSAKGAKAYRLWGNKSQSGNRFQLFRIVEDPANKGRYAIVCDALPEGSVSSTPTGTGTGDRWDYNTTGKDYGFVLDKAYYEEEGNTFRYAIRPANLEGFYMNFAKDGQGQAINVYNNPNDGKGGQILFVEATEGVNPNPPVATEIPAEGTYYRLHTRFNGSTSQARYGSVIELLRDNAGKGNNSQADRLWSNAPAVKTDANYDYQWFKFEADPSGSGYYALVCKAKPDGSVNSVPTFATNNTPARWDYDNAAKHYGFRLVATHNGNSTQGTDADGFYSALASKDAAQGWYVNTAGAPQGFAIHLYNNPLDQNAGLYTFEADPEMSGIGAPEAAGHRGGAIYDLQGRRLQSPSRGINIIDGRKVLVR